MKKTEAILQRYYEILFEKQTVENALSALKEQEIFIKQSNVNSNAMNVFGATQFPLFESQLDEFLTQAYSINFLFSQDIGSEEEQNLFSLYFDEMEILLHGFMNNILENSRKTLEYLNPHSGRSVDFEQSCNSFSENLDEMKKFVRNVSASINKDSWLKNIANTRSAAQNSLGTLWKVRAESYIQHLESYKVTFEEQLQSFPKDEKEIEIVSLKMFQQLQSWKKIFEKRNNIENNKKTFSEALLGKSDGYAKVSAKFFGKIDGVKDYLQQLVEEREKNLIELEQDVLKWKDVLEQWKDFKIQIQSFKQDPQFKDSDLNTEKIDSILEKAEMRIEILRKKIPVTDRLLKEEGAKYSKRKRNTLIEKECSELKKGFQEEYIRSNLMDLWIKRKDAFDHLEEEVFREFLFTEISTDIAVLGNTQKPIDLSKKLIELSQEQAAELKNILKKGDKSRIKWGSRLDSFQNAEEKELSEALKVIQEERELAKSPFQKISENLEQAKKEFDYAKKSKTIIYTHKRSVVKSFEILLKSNTSEKKSHSKDEIRTLFLNDQDFQDSLNKQYSFFRLGISDGDFESSEEKIFIQELFLTYFYELSFFVEDSATLLKNGKIFINSIVSVVKDIFQKDKNKENLKNYIIGKKFQQQSVSKKYQTESLILEIMASFSEDTTDANEIPSFIHLFFLNTASYLNSDFPFFVNRHFVGELTDYFFLSYYANDNSSQNIDEFFDRIQALLERIFLESPEWMNPLYKDHLLELIRGPYRSFFPIYEKFPEFKTALLASYPVKRGKNVHLRNIYKQGHKGKSSRYLKNMVDSIQKDLYAQSKNSEGSVDIVLRKVPADACKTLTGLVNWIVETCQIIIDKRKSQVPLTEDDLGDVAQIMQIMDQLFYFYSVSDLNEFFKNFYFLNTMSQQRDFSFQDIHARFLQTFLTADQFNILKQFRSLVHKELKTTLAFGKSDRKADKEGIQRILNQKLFVSGLASPSLERAQPDFFQSIWNVSNFFDRIVDLENDLQAISKKKSFPSVTSPMSSSLKNHTLEKLKFDNVTGNLVSDKSVENILDRRSFGPMTAQDKKKRSVGSKLLTRKDKGSAVDNKSSRTKEPSKVKDVFGQDLSLIKTNFFRFKMERDILSLGGANAISIPFYLKGNMGGFLFNVDGGVLELNFDAIYKLYDGDLESSHSKMSIFSIYLCGQEMLKLSKIFPQESSVQLFNRVLRKWLTLNHRCTKHILAVFFVLYKIDSEIIRDYKKNNYQLKNFIPGVPNRWGGKGEWLEKVFDFKNFENWDDISEFSLSNWKEDLPILYQIIDDYLDHFRKKKKDHSDFILEVCQESIFHVDDLDFFWMDDSTTTNFFHIENDTVFLKKRILELLFEKLDRVPLKEQIKTHGEKIIELPKQSLDLIRRKKEEKPFEAYEGEAFQIIPILENVFKFVRRMKNFLDDGFPLEESFVFALVVFSTECSMRGEEMLIFKFLERVNQSDLLDLLKNFVEQISLKIDSSMFEKRTLSGFFNDNPEFFVQSQKKKSKDSIGNYNEFQNLIRKVLFFDESYGKKFSFIDYFSQNVSLKKDFTPKAMEGSKEILSIKNGQPFVNQTHFRFWKKNLSIGQYHRNAKSLKKKEIQAFQEVYTLQKKMKKAKELRAAFGHSVDHNIAGADLELYKEDEMVFLTGLILYEMDKKKEKKHDVNPLFSLFGFQGNDDYINLFDFIQELLNKISPLKNQFYEQCHIENIFSQIYPEDHKKNLDLCIKWVRNVNKAA